MQSNQIPFYLPGGLKVSLMVWFGFFVKWQINLRMLFNAKTMFVGEHFRYDLTHRTGNKRIHTLLKAISPRVRIRARLEFELAYYEVTMLHVNHHSAGTLQIKLQIYSFSYSYIGQILKT